MSQLERPGARGSLLQRGNGRGLQQRAYFQQRRLDYLDFARGTALALFSPMTMLRLSRRRRDLLADKFPDAANVALGALAFGQFLGAQPVSLILVSIGTTTWLALRLLALWVSEGRDGR
jgi:hypothetical protein